MTRRRTLRGVAAEDPDQLVRDVGLRIRELRLGRGMTQEQAAERLGLSVKGYQFLEGGQNLTLRSLARIAAPLDTRTIDLLAPPTSRKVRRGRPRKSGA